MWWLEDFAFSKTWQTNWRKIIIITGRAPILTGKAITGTRTREGGKQPYCALTGVQTALLLVVVYDRSLKSTILGVPNLLLEAAHAPGDQNKPRISSAAVAYGSPVSPENRARIKGFGGVQRSADPQPIDRNSWKHRPRLANSFGCPNPRMDRRGNGKSPKRAGASMKVKENGLERRCTRASEGQRREETETRKRE